MYSTETFEKLNRAGNPTGIRVRYEITYRHSGCGFDIIKYRYKHSLSYRERSERKNGRTVYSSYSTGKGDAVWNLLLKQLRRRKDLRALH